METLSNKNITLEEAKNNLGTPDLKTRIKVFSDQIKNYINSRPRSHKRVPYAGLKQDRDHPLLVKFGGNLNE
jgi:hypothetical protein